MNEELLRELIKHIQEASPEIWAIAQQQVQVEIWRASIEMWGFGIASGFFLVISLLSLYFFFKKSKDDFLGVFLVCFCISFVPGFYAIERYMAIISKQMNPDYYAILSLIEFVK